MVSQVGKDFDQKSVFHVDYACQMLLVLFQDKKMHSQGLWFFFMLYLCFLYSGFLIIMKWARAAKLSEYLMHRFGKEMEIIRIRKTSVTFNLEEALYKSM